MENPKRKPWRPNVIAMAIGVLAIGVASAAGAAVVEEATLAGTLANIALVSATGLVTYGKDILKLDEAPFDQATADHELRIAQGKAEHEWRLATIEAERAKVEATTSAENSLALRKLELEHEFRNGQNETTHKLVDAVTGALPGPRSRPHPRE